MSIQLLALIITSVTMSSFAQICLKAGMNSADVSAAMKSFPSGKAALSIITSYQTMFGLVLYFLSAVLWLKVLSSLDVSIAYPFVGLGFIITMLLSFAFFQEPLTHQKILGTCVIISGIIILTRG